MEDRLQKSEAGEKTGSETNESWIITAKARIDLIMI